MDIEINDLAKIGSIRDQEGYQLPPEAFTFADEMRFTAEGVERMGGREPVFGTPTVAPHFVLPVQTATQMFWLYTSLTKAYVYDGTNHTDVTRLLGDYTAGLTRDWNGLLFGGVPIVNNGSDDPQYWLGPAIANRLAALPNWPANTKAKILRSLGSFLVAFDITKGATRYPHMVKWSHPAEPGTVPSSWNEADPTLDAGENDLPDVNSGIIQDALPLRGQMFIYKANSVWRMRFIGGQLIFGFDTLLDNAGLLAPRCVALSADGQKHIFATQDDIMIHNGTSAESILEGRMRKYLQNAIDPQNFANSFMFTDVAKNETWFCYPELTQTNPSRAIIFHNKTGNLSEASVNFRNAASGSIELPDPTTWDTGTTLWDAEIGAWSESIRRKVVLCATNATKFLLLDSGTLNDTAALTGTLRREGLGMLGRKRNGEWLVDFTKQKLVSRLWIKASGGPINIKVGFQHHPEGPVTWTPTRTFTAGSENTIEFTLSGKALAIEFSAATAFRITGFKFELATLGRY